MPIRIQGTGPRGGALIGMVTVHFAAFERVARLLASCWRGGAFLTQMNADEGLILGEGVRACAASGRCSPHARPRAIHGKAFRAVPYWAAP